MREDPGVIFLVVNAFIPVLAGAVDAVGASWGARQDPTWRTRWDESRRRIKFDLAALPVFVATSALVLAGILGAPALMVMLFGFTAARLLWIYRRERQIKGALEAQRILATATAG